MKTREKRGIADQLAGAAEKIVGEVIERTLGPREIAVLRSASYARHQVANGHFLVSPGQRRAAERLIERGLLTKARHRFVPPNPDLLVVKVTERNIERLVAEVETALRSGRPGTQQEARSERRERQGMKK